MSGKAPKEVNLIETESRWFKVLVVVVAAVSIVLFAYYTWTYNKLRTSTTSPISSGEATTLMWLSIVMLVLASIVFIWGIWRLFVAKGYREYLVSSAGKKVTQFVTTTEGGFAPADYAVVVPAATTAAVVVPTTTAAVVTPKPALRPAQVAVVPAAAPKNVQYALGTSRAAPVQPTAGRVQPRPAGVPVGATRVAVAPRPAQAQVLPALQAQTSNRSSRLPGQLPSSSRLPPTYAAPAYAQPQAPGVVPLVRSQVQINPR